MVASLDDRVRFHLPVSVYGLGRFSVTVYEERWARLLENAADTRAFLEEHDGELKAKGEKAGEHEGG